MSTITLDKLNAKDIYQLFGTLYKEKHGVEYQGVGFIGNEMHKLREVLDEYGSSSIACATLNCINANPKSVSIPYFVAGIKYYLVPYNPDIYWAVKRYSTPTIKKLWRTYMFLDSVWFPTATQRTKRKQALQELREWAYAKTGKKTRKANTKDETERDSDE